MEGNFEVVIHHSGKFIKEGKLTYEGESITYSFDPDMWSYFIVVSVVKGLGYDGFKELWYCVGGGSVLKNMLEPLLDDKGAMHMITLARLNGEVHFFVEHIVSEPEVIHMLEYVNENTAGGESQCEVPANEGERGHHVVEDEIQCEGKVTNDVNDDGNEVVEGEIECEGAVNDDVNDVVNDVVEGEIECEGSANDDLNDVGNDVVEGEIECEGAANDDINDCEGVANDVANDVVEDDVDGNAANDFMEGLVDVHVECDIEEEVGDEVGNVQVDVQSDGPSWAEMSDTDVDDSINSDKHRGLSDDDWESEELDSGMESDCEDDEKEGYGKFVTFSMPKTMVDYKWAVGTYFAEKQDFMDAIKTYAVQNGRNIKYLKNDKKRIRVKYMGGKGECPWMTYCGYMEAVKTWQLRTIVDNHSCSREHKVRLLNAKWLSKRLEK
ncbi:uncharacterized protein LOC111242260 [Vigna radiata var. radiata]|uniref:Uncharacterized protein LOC111242260 n=1 Tax=Vigna radiata var. radiata TaxID=3916 RepID=A0A3Q0FA39_VIGRR|nr:uncharacterized protein LOC111242260 [Vigna radiata var. radiata]